MTDKWPVDHVAVLKRLWAEGKTAKEISIALPVYSRNAIIGKARRLNLTPRMSPISNALRNQAKRNKVGRPRKIMVPINSTAPATVGLQFNDLKPKKNCYFPLCDHYLDTPHSWCGNDPHIGDYCEQHYKRVYNVK
jgi:hypothetical protein